ncbi:MAG: diacylglycerol kinase, partial [Candidatus Omnitrophica bacterium]|nr:diacylglycerol kinase [Candidatus Omnitrophota bacterium]
FNTAMEKVLDYASEDKFHALIKFAKDTLAAGVFVSSVSGVVIFMVIVLRHMLKLL